MEASAMRQVVPNAISYASWFFQKGAGGSATTTLAMMDANVRPPKPAQITRLARA